MADNPSANYPPLVSREQAGNAIGRALGLFVGRGRRYSTKELSNATGVKDRMIECAKLAPDNTDFRPLPDWALLSIARFLGADFTNVWLGLAGQGAFDLPDDEPEPGALAVEGCSDAANIVRIAHDGIDREERAELPAIGARMIYRGQQLVAMGAAA